MQEFLYGSDDGDLFGRCIENTKARVRHVAKTPSPELAYAIMLTGFMAYLCAASTASILLLRILRDYTSKSVDTMHGHTTVVHCKFC
jgi:hypothetical protein